MKRIVLSIICCVIAVVAMAQRFEYIYKGVTFKCKVADNGVCITGFNVKASDVTIPAIVSYKGIDYSVKEVNTFLNGVNYLTVNLTLEDGIETLDKFCFNEFRKLRNVSLPPSIKFIGKNAFRNNSMMTLTIPATFDENAIRQGVECRPDSISELMVSNNRAEENDRNRAEEEAVRQTKKVDEKTVKTEKETEPALLPVDVDMNIPMVATDKNKDTYCVIIANEKYEDVPEVEFAQRDGEVFKEYCIKTLGIPEKQIRTFINASYTDIKRALNWMETIDNVTEGQSKMLFYYAGHGMPNEADKTAYIIPTDGFPKDITTCFRLSEFYGRLGELKTKSVTVLLDACFSGVKRGSGQALVAARGVAIKPKEELLSGNVVVFAAASDDETALAYQNKRHGMFTYFLLKKLKETKGKVSFGEFFSTISLDVKKNSMLENDKLQTPSVNVSPRMSAKWKELQF